MFREDVLKELHATTGMAIGELDALVEVPPDPKLGDFAFPCFSLAKRFKKAPPIIASELSQKIKLKPGGALSRVEANGPYLNFFINRGKFSQEVLKKVLAQTSGYGAGPKKKERIMIEYSQANTHKAFHVGHLRGTSIGESLARILKFQGYTVLQANYQGDTGAHVAKWLWCYLKRHKGEKPPKKDSGKWVASIYVEAVKMLDENPHLQQEVDDVNFKLENNKDKALVKLWKDSRKWSLDEFEKIYKDLGAHFDYYFFEREVEAPGKEIVMKMLKQGIAEESDGAIIINLEKYSLGVWVLLRKDGTTLYSAKDLALARKKFDEYKIDKSIYVVGNAQSMHLSQLFKTLELMGYKQAKNCHHLSFEEVRLPSGKMSSRTGVNILYSDMRNEIFQYSEDETRKRHPAWSDVKVAKGVKSMSIAALKFDMLRIDHNKAIVFDTRKACDFDGETGPYVQYAHARICSILKQVKDYKPKGAQLEFSHEKEHCLIRLLANYPRLAEEAAEKYDPSIIAKYSLELAQAFSAFYQECPVLKSESVIRDSRLALIHGVRAVLASALGLLGIDAPEEM